VRVWGTSRGVHHKHDRGKAKGLDSVTELKEIEHSSLDLDQQLCLCIPLEKNATGVPGGVGWGGKKNI